MQEGVANNKCWIDMGDGHDGSATAATLQITNKTKPCSLQILFVMYYGSSAMESG